MGFEPTRAEHIGLAVQRLNHSATSSDEGIVRKLTKNFLYKNTIVEKVHNKMWKKLKHN